MNKKVKKYILKYTLEFLVIVLGISISFWLNELSVEKNENRERLKVLNNIKTEIKDIQKYTANRMKYWQDDIDLYTMFLSSEFEINSIKEITSSKSRVEYNLIYYRDFEPPMNRYVSMINTGSFKFIKSERVKEALTRLHTINYSNINTSVQYEKLLKEHLIEIITKNHPNLLFASNDSQFSIEDYSKLLKTEIEKDPILKSNLIIQQKYFETKKSLLTLYIYTLEELEVELNKTLQQY
ncbi:hypothetical protein OAB31_01450 [Polaribacter sp.]|jgi:hypothetical protein|nr:hypothetical protein [Polaribacter sp.]MDB9770849.1 hypothetical protein [Polaribacter sp.]MDC1374122.1 hypothetical protein [Polaribacter sp.]